MLTQESCLNSKRLSHVPCTLVWFPAVRMSFNLEVSLRIRERHPDCLDSEIAR
jgi:hypothetical protein